MLQSTLIMEQRSPPKNKVLKYSYLPKKKTMTLSSITTILIEDYLPDARRKYLFQSFQQSPHYRSYNDNIPAYLQGRPRNTILHCLDRKGSSNKLTLEDVTDVDAKQGVFSVCSLIRGESISWNLVQIQKIRCLAAPW